MKTKMTPIIISIFIEQITLQLQFWCIRGHCVNECHLLEEMIYKLILGILNSITKDWVNMSIIIPITTSSF